MSHDEKLKAWLNKNGMSSIREANGDPERIDEKVFKKNSELSKTFKAEAVGNRIWISDLYGYTAVYDRKELLDLIGKKGLLSSWSSFQRLGKLKDYYEE